MRRILAVLLVGTCVVVLAAPAAHAGGHGVARVVIGLATFAIFAPLIVVGEVIAHAVPPYRAPTVPAVVSIVFARAPNGRASIDRIRVGEFTRIVWASDRALAKFSVCGGELWSRTRCSRCRRANAFQQCS